jgi:large subunit ribosomal protein L29
MELEKDSQFERRRTEHQEKTTAEQLFRLRFQVSLGQNDGVKKLRQLRKEIAQIKTVARSASWASRRGQRRCCGTAKPAQPATARREPAK